ncbi:MAG: cell division protein FtsQ/DivIB, partial [Candidatus Gastranaerophilales bacterium]|nr:cell division protein FtsQ/DivIB [Candidatus Gastranaerophilales bacterium]
YKILTYEDYTKWSDEEIKYLNIFAQRLEDYSGEKLIYIDIRSKNNTYARLETVKVRIGELNSTLKTRIMRLNSIMPQIENLKNKIDYIDLRWDDSTYIKQRTPGSAPEEELIEEAEPTPVETPAPKKETVNQPAVPSVQTQAGTPAAPQKTAAPAQTEAKKEQTVKKTETKPVQPKSQTVAAPKPSTVKSNTTVSKPTAPKAKPEAEKEPVKLDAPPVPTVLMPE